MASKNKKKGKTMALTDFLAGDSKLVTVRGTSNWSEIVDSEEAEAKPIVVDIGILPTAPRGAVDIDYSTLITNPPFVAHIANLSFEIDDEDLRKIFGDLNPKSARVIREGTRSRGIGLVEFETRENLIQALKKSDSEVYGRKIRVNISDKTDSHQTDGNRRPFDNHRSNRGTGGEERPEMSGTWKRAEPRSNEPSDDRSSGGFNRDRRNRDDQGRSNTGGGSRDNQHGNDYGYGYPRKDDRGGGGGGGGGGGRDRDYNRQGQGQGQRNRYQDDDNRSNSGPDRPRYGGRYSDTRDTRDRNQTNDETRDDQRDAPRERPKLQLQPRTKPHEELQPLSGSSSSINNVAANAEQSLTSNPDDSLSSITNTTNQQIEDSSINDNENENGYQQQDSHESNSRVNTSDEQSSVKPSRGAGASIFGGAKPVDTTARELEIEKKIQEFQVSTKETSADNEEKTSSSRPSYNRGGEREVYRAKRPSYNDDHRDRRDDGRSGHSGDYHHRREHSGGRQNEDDDRKRNDNDHPRRGGGYDRDRYGGPSRRDHDSNRTGESNRTGKYNHPERDHNRTRNPDTNEYNDRGNNRNRNPDTNENNNPGRSPNNSESQPRHPQRGMVKRIIPTEDETNKLQLSNKFGMLDVEDLDDNNENEDVPSPSIDE